MAAENRNSNNNRSGVNRASKKVTKKSTAIARPAPKIYKIHPSCFRELVQELTGKGCEPATSQPPKPTPSSPPIQPCGRLQKFAPPPLGSQPDSFHGGGGGGGALNFDFVSRSPLPILSPGMFSPLASFTPMELSWADVMTAASPTSLEYKQLAQSLIERTEKSSNEEEDFRSLFALSPSAFRQMQGLPLQDSNARPPVASSAVSSSPYFLYSPRCGSYSPTFGLNSPGSFAGFDLGTI